MHCLQGDYLVLADRTFYTRVARMRTRLPGAAGCGIYTGLRQFGHYFYFERPWTMAVHRILSGRPKLKYYEAGMVWGMSYDGGTFPAVPGGILEEYDKMVDSRQFRGAGRNAAVNKLPKTNARHCAFKNRSQRLRSRVQEPE